MTAAACLSEIAIAGLSGGRIVHLACARDPAWLLVFVYMPGRVSAFCVWFVCVVCGRASGFQGVCVCMCIVYRCLSGFQGWYMCGLQVFVDHCGYYISIWLGKCLWFYGSLRHVFCKQYECKVYGTAVSKNISCGHLWILVSGLYMYFLKM